MSLPDLVAAHPSSKAPTWSSHARSKIIYFTLLAIATLIGLGLRLRAAQGDLWLDEIWTLLLLERAKEIGDVFVGIHHDNNHFLNSAWLWTVGPQASAILIRLPAILFGVLSIPAAAALGRRHNDVAGISAAFLIAISYFFVHYGSEARGYSGMILAVLLACNALEGIFEHEDSVGNYFLFGLSVCFGTFSHLTMVEATAALCLTAWARSARPHDSLKDSFRNAAPIFVLAAAATVPAVACFLVGALSPDFRVGLCEPFSLNTLSQGLADMARATLGFPRGLSDGAALIATVSLSLACAGLVPPHRRWFPMFAILGLPLLHAMVSLPNQMIPRFHLTSAIGLILLFADGLSGLWERRRVLQALAPLAFVSFAVAQASELSQFFAAGRGAYSEAVKAMSQDGPISFAVDAASVNFGTRQVLAYHAARLKLEARAVSESEWRETPPNWLIVANMPNSPADLPERKLAGPADRQTSFLRDRSFTAWGLSGFRWTLYRRADWGLSVTDWALRL